VAHAVEASRPAYKSRRHELTVTLPPDEMYLDADPARVAQVVGNLLSNAAKFTDDGGCVWLSVERDGQQAVIHVRDTGIGIAVAELPRLFDMFTQVDSSLERTRDGLGIGLTLVKTLVEMHGGTVEARSEGLGRGSEFVVRLPILAEASGPRPREAFRAAASTVRRRVLIVDDNEDSAESLAILLQLSGHETHVAHDGVEATDIAQCVRPDVILLDIGLPGLNGYEVCRRIRAQPWGSAVTLVAVTGWGQQEDRQRAREAGFDTHVVKPVEHEDLLKLLDLLPPSQTIGGEEKPDRR
jgi:CheY-like chemotaxis protein